MPYFYVSRVRPPHPFASSALIAGVIEADSLNDAKTRFAKSYQFVVDKGLGRISDFSVEDIDSKPRSDQGFVVATFTQMGG